MAETEPRTDFEGYTILIGIFIAWAVGACILALVFDILERCIRKTKTYYMTDRNDRIDNVENYDTYQMKRGTGRTDKHVDPPV